MLLTELNQRISLADGDYSPSHASDLVSSLIEEDINFHKLQRLSILEGNVNAPVQDINANIRALNEEKKILKDIIREARMEGRNVKVHATINITVE